MPAVYEKVCTTELRFSNELYVYQSAFPYKPKLIEIRKPRTLVLERVDGIPYLDVPELTDTMIIKLAQAVAALHSVLRLEGKVLCHWDNQPKNILWDEDRQRIILLDFEDIRLAHPETDIAHLFLFWAEVFNTPTLNRLVLAFINAYKSHNCCNQNRWIQQYSYTKARFDRRRNRYNKKEPAKNPDRLTNRTLLSKLTLVI